MKMKVMLGLAAVSLLASCGLIKTPPIVLQDTTKTPNPTVGGGALGIDGKGAPLDLSRGGITLQGTKTGVVIASGTFADVTDTQVTNNITRLTEWGYTQTMPTATLSGANCPASFAMTNVSFTATLSDAGGTGGVTRSAAATTSVPLVSFAAQSAGSCTYNATVSGAAAAITGVLLGTDLTTLGQIITTGGANTASLTGTYTTPDTVAGRTLTINFGGSSSYVIATIL
jgi:hypothetical protein